MLTEDFVVCKPGDVLTEVQVKICKSLKLKLETLRLILRACWVKGEGFQSLMNADDKDDEEEGGKEEGNSDDEMGEDE